MSASSPIDVTAAVISDDGKVLIARRAPGKHLEGYWEFPGGKVEKGELPEVSLKRELMEEFNVEVEVGDFLAESIYDYGGKTVRLLAYHVFGFASHYTLTDHDRIEWVEPNQLINWKLAPADLPIAKIVIGSVSQAGR